MAELRATQFYHAKVTNTAYATAYTVPAGRRIIVKSVALRNFGAAGQRAYLELAGQTALTKILDVSGSDGSVYEWRPWIVLGPGDLIRVAVDLVAGVNFIISGSNHFI